MSVLRQRTVKYQEAAPAAGASQLVRNRDHHSVVKRQVTYLPQVWDRPLGIDTKYN